MTCPTLRQFDIPRPNVLAQTVAMRLPGQTRDVLATVRAYSQAELIRRIGAAIRGFASIRGVAPIAVDWKMV